jgi:hypothetical protein
LPRIFYAASHSVLGSQIRDLDVLARVEVGSVLDCIHEDFAESGAYRSPLLFRKIGYFMDELQEAIRRPHVAPCQQANPLLGCGHNFDSLVPNRPARRQL